MIRDISFPKKRHPEISIVSTDNIDLSEYEAFNRADFYQFLWVNEGSATFEVDMRTVTVHPNTYLFIGKGMIYRPDFFNEYSGYLISFTDMFYARSEEDSVFLHDSMLFNNPLATAVRPTISHQSMIGYLLEIFQDSESALRENLLHSILKFLFLYAERRIRIMIPFEITYEKDQLLAIEFRNLVKKNFIEHKEIAYYTRRLGVSSKQLIQATKKTFGQTPKETIIDKLIMEAKRLLAYSGLSVKEIAYTLGFKEPNNFSVFFEKYTGELPGSFKKSIRPINSSPLSNLIEEEVFEYI